MTTLSINLEIAALTPDVVTATLTGIVRQVVTLSPGATVRARQRKAARSLRLPIGRVSDWWNGRVRRVEAHELLRIIYYAGQLDRVAEADRDYRRARRRALQDLAAAGGAAPGDRGAAAARDRTPPPGGAARAG